MHYTISHALREFVVTYGYWGVALALLCENAGIPVPGETALLLASFLAYSEHQLHLGWIIAIATCSATLGDNLGYAIGHYGGRPLLDRYQSLFRISPTTLQRGEEMFAHYGAAAIFFARFVFGMRVFAGPLAGVLRMRWRASTSWARPSGSPPSPAPDISSANIGAAWRESCSASISPF